MELAIKLSGVLQILLALLHFGFPRKFNWETELPRLSLLNSQIMKVHTFFIALLLFLLGILSITSSGLSIEGELGHRICLGIAIFWGIRFIFQLFVYSPSLWKGQTLETVIHVLFCMLWLFFTWSYLDPIL